jgi:protein TonB
MLAYAASRPRIGARSSSPNAMLAIIAAHVGLLAIVMSAKMEISRHRPEPPIDITFVKPVDPPPPNQPAQPQPAHRQTYTRPDTTVPFPPVDLPSVDPLPPVQNVDPWPAPSIDPPPHVDSRPLPPRSEALLLTPASELKPPYPQSKLLAEEEASLRLRLTIDARGRVVAVDPVRRADSVFLAAARRYLMAHWRYKPASEAGNPVQSSLVITLRFQLED